MGYSHVVSGAVAGLALLPVAPVAGPAGSVAWVLLWAGSTLLPDLDSVGASASRMWGPISRAIAGVVSHVSGGHRWGTHDLLLGPASFGALAALAVLVPPAATVVVAVALGLMIHGLHVTRLWRTGPVVNFLVSWIGAGMALSSGWVSVGWWLPIAVAGGVVVAILGDALTTELVPVPLVWMRSRSHRMGLGAFRTGQAVEQLLVAPALTIVVEEGRGLARHGVPFGHGAEAVHASPTPVLRTVRTTRRIARVLRADNGSTEARRGVDQRPRPRGAPSRPARAPGVTHG